MTDDTFVIGDVHGHLDRLTKLLQQEGLLDDKGDRLRPDVTVVQLGDFGHWGYATEQEDDETVTVAPAWLDVMLWGNHDRALVEERTHGFGGYRRSEPHVIHKVLALLSSGKLKLAYEAHGFLLTHAGLHPKLIEKPMSAAVCAKWLNDEVEPSDTRVPVRDSISFERGGSHFCGGVLWRDAKEALSFQFPQVFGHTAHPPKVRTYKHVPEDGGDEILSYCVDIGDKGDHGKLAGIWLPSETVAEVET